MSGKNCNQWYSDNDEDCSCSSCECSSSSDKNILGENDRISFQPMIIHKSPYPTSLISPINTSLNGLNKSDCFSINSNHSKMIEHQLENKKQEFSPIDLEHIYEIIDQSYTKMPILYNSIKQTKLDPDFIFSVNNYLNQLKSNIYKDLIRRETLLRNGKNHTKNLISLIRCICKISYEQALEISKNSNPSKYGVLYTMTAIDYILQNNYPQKKSLFNYILNEYISMWLHENLRTIQEDFCIILENGRKKNFFAFCICFFKKFESICAINWERLQMIQNYRLTHFDQLFKPTSIQLETNKDWILLFGKPLKLTMTKCDIPVTSLYSNRTDNELINIDQIHQTFRESIAKILRSHIEEGEKLISHPPQSITPSIEITTSTAILGKQQSRSKLASLEHQQLSESIEMTFNQNMLDSTQTHQSSSQSYNSSAHSQTSSNMKIDISSSIKTSEPINSFNDSISPPTSINLLSQSLSRTSTPIISTKSESQKSNSDHLLQQPPPYFTFISPKNSSADNHLLTSSDKSIRTDSKAILNTEILTYPPSLISQKNETSPLLKQLQSCLKKTNIDPNLIIENIRQTHSQSSFNVKDPLFLAEFTRVLRKELEDAQVLRDIDCGQLNEDSQKIGYLSFETSNILKLPKINTFMKKNDTAAGDNIDQNRIFIEVIHDPSRCPPTSAQQHQQFNHNSSPISINRNSSSLDPNQSQQRWYWIRSNESSLSKDCLITSDSLFCTRKSFDKNSYSITVEHNEEFEDNII